MTAAPARPTFLICIQNGGYAASLELLKLYRLIPDEDARQHGLIRIIDESGEDYLYPAAYFLPIDLPEETRDALASLAGRPAA